MNKPLLFLVLFLLGLPLAFPLTSVQLSSDINESIFASFVPYNGASYNVDLNNKNISANTFYGFLNYAYLYNVPTVSCNSGYAIQNATGSSFQCVAIGTGGGGGSGNASTGVCASGQVVQNITTGAPQCVSLIATGGNATTNQIDALNASMQLKLNISDQRYNSTALILAVNASRAIAGTCSAGFAVQNATATSFQCVALSSGTGNATTNQIDALNLSKLDKTDQRYNDTTLISTVNTTLNNTKLNIDDQRYNSTALILAVNSSRAIAGVCSSGFAVQNATATSFQCVAIGTSGGTGNASTGSCASGQVVQNITTGAPQCVAASGGGGSGTVNSGLTGEVAYYVSSGTAVQGNPNMVISPSTGYLGLYNTSPTSPFTLNASTTGKALAYIGQKAAWDFFTNYALDISGYTNMNGFRLNGNDFPNSVYGSANNNMGFSVDTGKVITFSIVGGSEVMRIKSTGVGIGTSTPAGKLDVAGTLYATLTNSGQSSAVCYNSATGEITYNSGVTTCVVSSETFKKNIATLNWGSGMETIMNLRPVEYEYINQSLPQKRQTVPTQYFNDGQNYTEIKSDKPIEKESVSKSPQFTPKHVGFLAEEVQSIDPRLVALNEDGKPQSVRYEELTSVLVQSMQEMKMRIDAQEVEIKKLKEQVASLKGEKPLDPVMP